MALFQKGNRANPGGRPSIAKLFDEFGRSPQDIRVKMVKQAVEIVEAGPKGTNDAVFRYMHDWLAAHVGMRPPKTLDVNISDGGDDEIDIDALGPDELGALERVLKQRLGIEDDAPDGTTVQ